MHIDPRWLVVLGAVGFYSTFYYVAHNGRRVAASTVADRPLNLSHHKGGLWGFAFASLFLLFLVEVVWRPSTGTYSGLFWVHAGLDGALVILIALALIYNGSHAPRLHRRFVYLAIACSILVGVTGGILLYRL